MYCNAVVAECPSQVRSEEFNIPIKIKISRLSMFLRKIGTQINDENADFFFLVDIDLRLSVSYI